MAPKSVKVLIPFVLLCVVLIGVYYAVELLVVASAVSLEEGDAASDIGGDRGSPNATLRGNLTAPSEASQVSANATTTVRESSSGI